MSHNKKITGCLAVIIGMWPMVAYAEVAFTESVRGLNLLRAEKFSEADAEFSIGVESVESRDSPKLGSIMLYRGMARTELAQFGTAENDLKKALSLAEANSLASVKGEAYRALGILYLVKGQYSLAKEFCESALKQSTIAETRQEELKTLSMACLARVSTITEVELDKVDAIFDQLAASLTDRLDIFPLDRARIYIWRARRLAERQQYTRAESDLRRAKQLCRSAVGENSLCAVESQSIWARYFYAMGNPVLETAYEARLAQNLATAAGIDQDHPLRGEILLTEGFLAIRKSEGSLVVLEKYAYDSLDRLNRSAEIFIKKYGEHPALAGVLEVRAALFTMGNRPAEADADFNRAAEIYAKFFEESHSARRRVLQNWSTSKAFRGDSKGADELSKRADELSKRAEESSRRAVAPRDTGAENPQ